MYYSQTLYAVVSVVIRFMRVDTLSLLLSMANIGAYSDVLVVDMVGGLVVGAVAERLGGKIYSSFSLVVYGKHWLRSGHMA
jgi:tRNA (adenine58-N1)-methyltransferase non-catalytic subunit